MESHYRAKSKIVCSVATENFRKIQRSSERMSDILRDVTASYRYVLKPKWLYFRREPSILTLKESHISYKRDQDIVI